MLQLRRRGIGGGGMGGMQGALTHSPKRTTTNMRTEKDILNPYSHYPAEGVGDVTVGLLDPDTLQVTTLPTHAGFLGGEGGGVGGKSWVGKDWDDEKGGGGQVHYEEGGWMGLLGSGSGMPWLWK